MTYRWHHNMKHKLITQYKLTAVLPVDAWGYMFGSKCFRLFSRRSVKALHSPCSSIMVGPRGTLHTQITNVSHHYTPDTHLPFMIDSSIRLVSVSHKILKSRSLSSIVMCFGVQTISAEYTHTNTYWKMVGPKTIDKFLDVIRFRWLSAATRDRKYNR